MPQGYDLEITSGDDIGIQSDGISVFPRSSSRSENGKNKFKKGGSSGYNGTSSKPSRAISSVAERAQQQLDNHPSEEESRRVSIPLLLVFVALLILIVYVIYLEFIA